MLPDDAVRRLSRLATMDLSELGWRVRAIGRSAFDRAQQALGPGHWDRRRLADQLAPQPGLRAVARALTACRWNDAHQLLSLHFHDAPQRFPIAAASRDSLSARILAACPNSAADAGARALRIVEGHYDLLGYRGLVFQAGTSGNDGIMPDWHYDPVHHRRAPLHFWSSVPYLDPSCGDHKVIWELNRHQHWLALGRAWWLNGDPRYRDRAIDELSHWLGANPPLAGINWASMLELSLRSISWLWALHFFVDPAIGDPEPWTVDLLVALDAQLAHVERNLSIYFSPNTHLLGEALALYVGGRSLPELRASDRRAAIGRAFLIQEATRQIASDGGHRERSAHYHRYALDFYLLALIVARVTADPAAGLFEGAVERLASAARLLADGTGHLPHFGDDDGGRLAPFTARAADDIRDSLATASGILNADDWRIGDEVPEETMWMLSAPAATPVGPARGAAPARAITSGALPETGYYVSRSAEGHHLVIDGGPHGFQNGGHAHADALSLTLAHRGTPLLIDPGTGHYTVAPVWRDRLRSSHMHNTLVLNGRSQSQPAGPFQWKTTANTRVDRWITRGAFDYFAAAHDGYDAEHGVRHHRRVLSMPGDLVVVADIIEGSGTHTASAHWHLSPEWQARVSDRLRPSVTLNRGADACQLLFTRGHVELFRGDHDTGLGWHSPVYGRIDPTTTVRATVTDSAPFWLVTVFGLDPANAVGAVEPNERPHAPGVSIARAQSTDVVLFMADMGLSFTRDFGAGGNGRIAFQA